MLPSVNQLNGFVFSFSPIFSSGKVVVRYVQNNPKQLGASFIKWLTKAVCLVFGFSNELLLEGLLFIAYGSNLIGKLN